MVPLSGAAGARGAAFAGVGAAFAGGGLAVLLAADGAVGAGAAAGAAVVDVAGLARAGVALAPASMVGGARKARSESPKIVTTPRTNISNIPEVTTVLVRTGMAREYTIVFQGEGMTAKILLALAVGGAIATAPVARAAASPAGAPKYYFEVHKVESELPLNEDLRTFTMTALQEELKSRPEWASDLGAGTDRAALAAELKKRKLRGFDLVVKIAALKKDVKEPNPGSRLRRLSVGVKLAVLGTTIPGEKIAFGGDGEAGAETDVTERRIDVEADTLTRDAIKDAIKQAIDQAVMKLSLPKAAPLNESKRKRKKH